MTILTELFDQITDRKTVPKEGSYTNYLFDRGLDKILKKVGEETTEVVIAAKNNDNAELTSELADLTYHILVLLAQQGLTPEDIAHELEKREGKLSVTKDRKPIDEL